MPPLELPYPLNQSLPAHTPARIPGWTHVGNSGSETMSDAIREYADWFDDDTVLTARPFEPDDETRFAVYRRNDR